MNVAGLEPAPPGNQPGALTTKPYVLIKLRRNFYTRKNICLYVYDDGEFDITIFYCTSNLGDSHKTNVMIIIRKLTYNIPFIHVGGTQIKFVKEIKTLEII